MADDAPTAPPTLTDESQVPEYELPDPLVREDGKRVTSAADWTACRRPELLRLFGEHVYGHTPERPFEQRAEIVEESDDALAGRAIRRQLEMIFTTGHGELRSNLLIYLPKDAPRPAPVFCGLNFAGNNTIHPDPAIRLTRSWVRSRSDPNAVDNRATEQSRGVRARRWPVEQIIDRGYGLAAIHYSDLDPDYEDGFANGVHGLIDGPPADPRPASAWGAIGAWAWGLSRAMDYFETDGEIDHARVALMGHSRLGKTALWAGARDPRFAIVISNDSGCGGAALFRRRFGETIDHMRHNGIDYWFCSRYGEYAGGEPEMPVDQHELIALVAPRPVYVASAVEDTWADPKGEFLALKHAAPVYALFDVDLPDLDEMPGELEPRHGGVGYHIRPGRHGVTDDDWRLWMDFADRQWRVTGI